MVWVWTWRNGWDGIEQMGVGLRVEKGLEGDVSGTQRPQSYISL